jgi:3-phosphoshikimate 1-carboxyvinyltransferase
MDVKIIPGPLSGICEAIPSKSDLHRLLILAALADCPTRIELSARPGAVRLSADLEATLRCLRALGADIVRVGNALSVTPAENIPEEPLLDCGESGSTLRFLLPVAAALCPRARFTGGGRLPQRPLGDLRTAMEAHGVIFSAPALPFTISGRMTGGEFSLPGNVSSQYITGLLLALPHLREDSRLTLTTPLQSAGYVEITRHALSRFGVSVRSAEHGYLIPGGQTVRSPQQMTADGDWSNAAFFLTAGALSGEIGVEGLHPDSPQGDREIVPLLRQMGGQIRERDGMFRTRTSRLLGTEIDMGDIPDLLPVLASAAAVSGGETHFLNAARLRLKESDRLATTASMLRSLGGQVRELPDGLTVRGVQSLAGGMVNGAGDHRIVMAAAVAAVRCREPVTILGADAVSKSYPDFFEVYRELGGNVHVL